MLTVFYVYSSVLIGFIVWLMLPRLYDIIRAVFARRTRQFVALPPEAQAFLEEMEQSLTVSARKIMNRLAWDAMEVKLMLATEFHLQDVELIRKLMQSLDTGECNREITQCEKTMKAEAATKLALLVGKIPLQAIRECTKQLNAMPERVIKEVQKETLNRIRTENGLEENQE